MLIFAAICFGCALFFIISIFTGAGDSADSDFHGIDLGHAGDIAHGAGDVSHHDAAGTPKIFSIRVIMLFGMGFGAVGAIARYTGSTIAMSSVWGALSGVVLGAAGYFFFSMIFHQQASTPMISSSLVGKSAEVMTAIPANGLGQILTTDNYGRNVYLTARSDDGSAVASNTTVTIASVSGNVVVIKVIK
jgi:membrane protein implicated in regulation of membrane protease activity